MPLIFPTSPTPNQTYQSGSSSTYQWNGSYWETITPPTQIIATALSASFATSASFAVSSSRAVSSSFATTASYARSASFVIGGTVPTWTVAGAVVGATTTPPTIVGTTRAAHNYRQIGPKEIEFTFILDYNGTGGANGNGDYLITLPGGYSIDTTLANQTIYTGGVGLSDNNFYRYTVPGGYGWWSITAGTAGWGVQPIVYDATRIRFMILNYGSYIRCWGSNALGVTAGIYLTARYTFQVV